MGSKCKHKHYGIRYAVVKEACPETAQGCERGDHRRFTGDIAICVACGSESQYRGYSYAGGNATPYGGWKPAGTFRKYCRLHSRTECTEKPECPV